MVDVSSITILSLSAYERIHNCQNLTLVAHHQYEVLDLPFSWSPLNGRHFFFNRTINVSGITVFVLALGTEQNSIAVKVFFGCPTN